MTAAASQAQFAPPWQQRRRVFNGFGLVLTVLVHLVILAVVLTWRSQQPPPKPRNMDVSLILPKEQVRPVEPPVLAPKPEFQPLSLPAIPEPPPINVIEIPPPAPLAPAVAPPVAAPAPAPAAAPPVVAATPAAAANTAAPKLFEVCEDAPDRQMVAEVYELRPGTNSVTEMRRRKPVKTVCLGQLDITPRDFREGFPGMELKEWFGLDIRFVVNIPEDMTRELMLLADDGAILSVDDVNVIYNDGVHPPTPVATTLKLTKGPHHFRIRYFQGPGPVLALMLAWKKPEAADFQYIPRRLLGRPPAAATAP